MIHFLTPRAGAFGIRDFVELHAPALASTLKIHHYEDLPRLRTAPSGTWIFSGLDQLTPGGMALVRELVQHLRRPDGGSHVLNDPAHVLLRFELLDALHREGLNRHAAVRATGHLQGLRFPVFVHEEFQHNGAISPLLYDHTQLERALGRAVLRGYKLRELLVVEFCDTSNAAGRYHRYAAFAVGSAIVARELMTGSDWMLKSTANAPSEKELLEERAWVVGNPHERELRKIFEMAGIQYGRIDYALRDGTVETWEINLNPTIRRGRAPDHALLSGELDALRETARQHFTRMFESALRSVDRDLQGPEVPLRFSEACLRDSTPMIKSRGRAWRKLFSRVVWPVSPLVRRAMQALSPLVARMARRARARMD